MGLSHIERYQRLKHAICTVPSSLLDVFVGDREGTGKWVAGFTV
jgi:hypothetical protein